MPEVLQTIATAAGIFVGTNLDDIVVLTVLFLSGRSTGRPTPVQVWIGQYLGIGALVALSVVGALGLTLVPDRWVGLLGFIPFVLGARGLIAAIRAPTDVDRHAPVASGLLPVFGVTIANGADNLSVYTPMFRTIGLAAGLVSVMVFAVGVALWCLAGTWLGGHPQVIEVVRRWGHWIVPVVFVAIGTVIVIESEVIHALISLIGA